MPDGIDDEQVGAIFAALADPTRRAVLTAVATGERATASELGQAVGVSRQAVAKHLDVLAAAGLVAGARIGRERRWHVTPSPLSDAAAWLDRTGTAWDARLARLAASAGGPPPEG